MVIEQIVFTLTRPYLQGILVSEHTIKREMSGVCIVSVIMASCNVKFTAAPLLWDRRS